jgi:tetraacyldisaccharide 4'-kinase
MSPAMRGKASSFLAHHWCRLSWFSVILMPLAGLYAIVIALRVAAYRTGLMRVHRLPVPVVIVGNITVGGTGKTPLVLWLCDFLHDRGFRPGIVSRGYGGKGGTSAVRPDDDPALSGDEPVLLAQRSRAPVWIGRDRTAAACALLLAHPECDVIVSDDGLQHLAMARDMEIAVVDARFGLGNGWLLPAGPLRESASRLGRVDALVVNGNGEQPLPGIAPMQMKLEGKVFANLLNPDFRISASGFAGKSVHALAGIGNPARFFEHLRNTGLSFVAHAFPDHHDFMAADLEFSGAEAIVMTEKDAIKCRRFARENHWYLPVDAHVDPALGEKLLHKLKSRHGSQTA